MQKPRGHYMGTDIERRWYRRYRADGFFARGTGEWWVEDGHFRFKRKLLKRIVDIPLSEVEDIRQGSWHCGQWAIGRRVIKIDWIRGGRRLSSGFVLTRTADQAGHIVDRLREHVADSKRRLNGSSTRDTA